MKTNEIRKMTTEDINKKIEELKSEIDENSGVQIIEFKNKDYEN